MECIIFNVILNVFVWVFSYVLYKGFKEASGTPKRKEKKKRGFN